MFEAIWIRSGVELGRHISLPVYLALHALCTRLISNPDSKVRWFFSVVTSPLTRPVRLWATPEISESRLLHVALVLYGVLWVLMMVITQLLAGVRR